MKFSACSEYVWSNESFSHTNSLEIMDSCSECDKNKDNFNQENSIYNDYCIRKFRKRVLDLHNSYRGMHDTIPLLEDAYLNHSAQTLANHLAQNGFNPHPDYNKSYGENISVSFSNQPLSKSLTKSNKLKI